MNASDFRSSTRHRVRRLHYCTQPRPPAPPQSSLLGLFARQTRGGDDGLLLVPSFTRRVLQNTRDNEMLKVSPPPIQGFYYNRRRVLSIPTNTMRQGGAEL